MYFPLFTTHRDPNLGFCIPLATGEGTTGAKCLPRRETHGEGGAQWKTDCAPWCRWGGGASRALSWRLPSKAPGAGSLQIATKGTKVIPLGRSLLTFSKHFLIFYLSPPHNVHVRWVLSLPSDRREMKPVKAYCKWQDGLSGSRHKVSFPLLAQQGDLELAAYPVGLSLLICNLVSKHPSFVTGYKECRLERPSFKSQCTLC